MPCRELLMAFPVVIISLLGCADAHAQYDSDTAYYLSYEKQVTGRFYFSRKFTALVLRDGGHTLRYRPNTSLNMGVGATYRWATLNLGYGFGFLNPERGRGDTRYLDLQFHSYGRKITVDVLGQFYRGFYLAPKGRAAAAENDYYLRPDLAVNMWGGTIQYVVNHERFSYRAAFLQNEWQKKSAGSLLVGLEIYAGNVTADSTLVPTAIDHSAALLNVNTVRFFEAGPSAGYAYTFVYRRNFFFTGAASLSLDVGTNTFRDREGKDRITGVSPNSLFRFSTGYNSGVWSVNCLYVSNVLRLAQNDRGRSLALNTGNFRVNLVYRFRPGKKIKKYLDVIEEVEDEVGKQ